MNQYTRSGRQSVQIGDALMVRAKPGSELAQAQSQYRQVHQALEQNRRANEQILREYTFQ